MKRAGISAVVMVALALAGVGIAGARAPHAGRASALDPSFGRGGKVLAAGPPAVTESSFGSILAQPEGALLVEASWETGRYRGNPREIQRRLPDGSLDRSFGADGSVKVPFGEGLGLRPGGGVLVAVDNCGDGASGVVLLNSGGTKAGTFGRNGCGGPLPFRPELLAPLPDGSVLVAGSETVGPSRRDIPESREPELAKLLPDGRLDPSFGRGGVVRIGGEVEPEVEIVLPRAIAATADGGALVSVGKTLMRLTAAGALDRGFGSAGVLTGVEERPEGQLNLWANGILALPDGRALVVSTATESLPEAAGEVVLRRLLPEGRLDPSFGAGGRVVLPAGPSARAKAVAAMPAGGALVLAELSDGELCSRRCPPILVSVGPDGALDRGYGQDGIAKLAPLPPEGNAAVDSLVTAADGSSAVAGDGADAILFARTPTGAPNREFGVDGKLLERHFRPSALAATGILLRPGGGLTVTASGEAGSSRKRQFLLGFSGDGRRDRGQTALVPTEAPPDEDGGICAGRGRTVIYGSTVEGEGDTVVAVGPRGRLVPSFGEDGVATMPKGFDLERVECGPRGSATVLGTAGRAMGVYRLDAHGHPLERFGRRGLAKVTFADLDAGAVAGLVQADGRVVVAGWAGLHVAAARLLPDGRLDRAFGRRGRVEGLLRHYTYATLVTALGDGVVIAGRGERYPYSLAGIVRLDQRGRLVRGFGRGGVVHPPLALPPIGLFAAHGRIVLVADPSTGKHEWLGHGVELRAYRRDGSPDRGFGHAGVVRAALEGRRFVPAAAMQQANGRIVVAGSVGGAKAGPRERVELLGFR